jgi:hypothetical protein
MKPEKTHTEPKKSGESPHTNYSKNLLYQLESIVKTLYPNHKTTNPYEAYLEVYYNELNIEDVLLFKRLLKSITVLNHKERVQSNKRYISSYGDVLTTIELLSKHTISDIILSSYVQLKEVFRDHPFTKLQAARVLRKSLRSIDRYLQLWTHLQLIEKTNIKHGSKHTYKLLGYQQAIYEEENQGFIDLEYRT